MKRKAAILATVIMATLPLASCANQPKDEIPYTPPTVERYQNHIEIEGQWGASNATGANGQYGIGDPFVMRWNGKYYLYPSTSDPCDGIKVFESEDLIHWTDKGFAVVETERTVHGAYAPEVVYYNGYFYLCQSRAGRGHYIYRSESPTEGFERISVSAADEADIDYGNLGMGIDGSFYVSDDGKLYLMHTSTPAGLKFNEITDVGNINPDTIGSTGTLGESNLNGWIEGPGVFRRGDFSYLTYTGNHVISRGYRVGYSYAENLENLSSFIQPTDNVTLIDTAADHYGLGHSSNVNGPDLDSVYTAYHNLVGNGPARRFNLDRYFASGSVLTANGVTHRPVAVPAKPAASGYSEALKAENGSYVLGETEGYFTAEYNFVPAEGQALLFGKTESNEYKIEVTENQIALKKNGTLVGNADVFVASGRLATVRVENGDGVGHIYFNGMRVITWDAEAAAGNLGYTSDMGVGYTAFTNDVFGTSDFEAFKNFPTKFPATSYLKDEMRGFSIAKAKRAKGGVRVGEKESTLRVGDAYAVSLAKNDWVKYAIDVPEDGYYSIAAELTKASAGAQIKVSIGEESFIATLPALGADTVRVYLGDIYAAGGVGAMKVEVVSGTAQIILFDVGESAHGGEVALDKYTVANGSVKLEGGALIISQVNGVALWQNTNAVNFEASISFSCAADIGSDFGFMFRASNYSSFSEQPAQSWRGYYLQLGPSLVALRRYDYGDTGTLDSARAGSVDLTNGSRHTLVIRAEGHGFTLTLDGVVALSAEDACAFFGGELGVYVGYGEMTIYSIDFKTL